MYRDNPQIPKSTFHSYADQIHVVIIIMLLLNLLVAIILWKGKKAVPSLSIAAVGIGAISLMIALFINV